MAKMCQHLGLLLELEKKQAQFVEIEKKQASDQSVEVTKSLNLVV